MQAMREQGQRPKSLYVHIPFCTNKCYYCDFNSVIATGQPTEAYIEAILNEAHRTVSAEQGAPVIDTVFIGGGTPTVLTAGQLAYLFTELQRRFVIAPDAEWTVEANPGTVDREKLDAMRAVGVNRLSFGVQAFDDALLRSLGRVHQVIDVERSVDLAQTVGFDHISLDLMFGLPQQTIDHVQASVERALALRVPHVSIYGLKVEPNTAFFRWQEQGRLLLPSEDEEIEMYEWLCERLRRAGYEQYEVSNFARPRYRCRHNTVYWRNEPYYGLGAGAHGYVRGVRHVNVRGVQQYIVATEQGLPRETTTIVTVEEAMEETMMLGLRLLDEGVEEKSFLTRFGVAVTDVFAPVLMELQRQQLIRIDQGRIRLTQKGLLLGNEVFGAFLGELDHTAAHTQRSGGMST